MNDDARTQPGRTQPARIARPRTHGDLAPAAGTRPVAPEPVPERRRRSRRNVRCACWLHGEGQSVYSAEADVEGGQLFLRTAVPLGVGEQVEVSLCLRGRDAAVEARGVVTRIVDSVRGQRAAVGVELSEILDGPGELLQPLA